MKSREFLDILTRVVNSRSGPRFLAVLHQLREILEEAGIAEEPQARIEAGKPLRQRAPEEVDRRTREAEPPRPANGTAGEPPAAEGNQVSPPAEGTVVPDDPVEAAVLTEVDSPAPPAASEFIEAGPNHLIRNPESSPPAPEAPAAEAAPPDSIRAIVQEALEAGGKTMAQIRQIIHEKKGPVSHIVAQVHAAIEKLGARRGARGMYGFSTGEAPPARKRSSKSRIASLPEDGPERAADPSAPGAEGPEEHPPDGDPAGGDEGFKQLSLLEDASASKQASDSDPS